MGKLSLATSLVALTLLGCLVGTEVEPQYFLLNSPQMPRTFAPQQQQSSVDQWFPPGYPQSEESPLIVKPLPHPAAPKVPTPPQIPSKPQYPQFPLNPPPAKVPSSLHWPQNPPQAKVPTSPQWTLNPPAPNVPVSSHWPPNLPPQNIPTSPQRPPKVHHHPQWPHKDPPILLGLQKPTPPPTKIPTPPQKQQITTTLPPMLPPQWPQNIPPPNIPISPHWPANPFPPKVPIPPHLPSKPLPPNIPISPQWPPKLPSHHHHWPPRVPQYPNLWPPKIPTSPQKPQVPGTLPSTVPPQPKPPQNPTLPQEPASFPTPATQQSIQSCDVAHAQRIPCGLSGITAAACTAISCCFDGHQCYYGKAVTVQCTKDAQFIVVIAKDATLPKIDLQSISLLGEGQGCTNVDSNSKFAIYQFPVTACGTTVTEQPGVIIYENRMTSSYEVGVGPLGAITRDSLYQLIFQCRYIGTSVKSVVAQVLPLQDPPLPVAALGPITVELRLANGQCQTKGCKEVDVAYNSFYTQYPVTKVLRDPVYVEVHLTGKTDPNLVLTLGHCWTTTSPTPHSLPQWDILVDGCPYKDDRYLSSLVPVGPSSHLDFPTHYRRFVFQMFTFVDPTSLAHLKENVYIHCSTAVCTAAPGSSCEPSCARKKRDVKATDQKNTEPKVVASVGPVIMGAPEQQTAQNLVENIR